MSRHCHSGSADVRSSAVVALASPVRVSNWVGKGLLSSTRDNLGWHSAHWEIRSPKRDRLLARRILGFWRDAKQPDLVKIRWLGPAHVVMKEYKEPQRPDSQVSVYWLSFKTQLVRCAPHHARPEGKAEKGRGQG